MRRSIAWILFGVLSWGRVVAEGATFTWDGGGSDYNWSTPENWSPDGAIPVSDSNTIVQLDGTTRNSSVQNIATPFTLNRLEILNGPLGGGKAAMVLSGSQLQFALDGATQPRIYLTREATCAMSNNIDIATGLTLEMQIGTYGLNFNGVISGGGSIDKLPTAGAITLNNSANSFSGGLTVRAVDLDWYHVIVNASNAMGTGQVNLYGGTLITNAANPGGLKFFSTTSHTNAINLFQNSPIFAVGNVTLNGNIDMNISTLTLRGGGTGTINGAISEGATNGVTKVDTGTWTLAGANTFTGAVTVIAGTLTVNGSVNSDIEVQGGATLNGSGTLKWLAGEKVDVAGTLDISQLNLDLQWPESEGNDFIIVDYGSGSLVGAAFASVTGRPSNCRLIYDDPNKLILLRSYEKGTVLLIH